MPPSSFVVTPYYHQSALFDAFRRRLLIYVAAVSPCVTVVQSCRRLAIQLRRRSLALNDLL